uniref:AMP-binding protein n=1 Tax=Aquisalimonas sp. TaxID=1872621 RepID=UPI0025C4D73F
MATNDFSWSRLERELLPDSEGGSMNIAYAALEHHARAGTGDATALIWHGHGGARRTVSYSELRDGAMRFASALAARGIGFSERVSTLAPRVPEVYAAGLGALWRGAVFAPLFSVYGPEPVSRRLMVGEARVLVTTEQLYRERVAPIRSRLPGLEHVVLLDGELPGTQHWETFCGTARPAPVAATRAEYPAVLHFTSGTTGTPKCVLHVQRAVVAYMVSGRDVLGLKPGTRYWCTADPGWVTGVTYGLIVPLLCGATMVVDESDFDARRWYGIIESERVECLFTTPTELRMLQLAGNELAASYDLSTLDRIFSTGEPLDPALHRWVRETLGTPPRDAWSQSETGVAMIAQYGDDPVTPGCMGRPTPGIEMALVTRSDDGVAPVGDGEVGQIALRAGWPSMFRAYLGDPARYRARFSGDWYLSGDTAQRDEAGELHFVGRLDDIIKTHGYMVGPAEVEAVL